MVCVVAGLRLRGFWRVLVVVCAFTGFGEGWESFELKIWRQAKVGSLRLPVTKLAVGMSLQAKPRRA